MFKCILYSAILSPILLGVMTRAFSHETCPTVIEIQKKNFRGWIPVYSSSNERASKEHIKKFIREIGQFFQAEYFDDFFFNGHCYYSGYQEVYLAKYFTSTPYFEKGKWILKGEVWKCHSQSVEQCPFSIKN